MLFLFFLKDLKGHPLISDAFYLTDNHPSIYKPLIQIRLCQDKQSSSKCLFTFISLCVLFGWHQNPPRSAGNGCLPCIYAGDLNPNLPSGSLHWGSGAARLLNTPTLQFPHHLNLPQISISDSPLCANIHFWEFAFPIWAFSHGLWGSSLSRKPFFSVQTCTDIIYTGQFTVHMKEPSAWYYYECYGSARISLSCLLQ